MTDSERLDLDHVPAPLEPLTPTVAPENQQLDDTDRAERLARLKAHLSRWERRRLIRRELQLWKQLTRAGYNDLVTRRYEVWQQFEAAKADYLKATDGRAHIAARGRKLAAAGRQLNARLTALAPLHDEYESVRYRLEAHDAAIARDVEDEENRAAFYQEKQVYEELIKDTLRRLPKVHHVSKDEKGRETIRIPQIEHVFISEDRLYFKILTASQNMFQRLTGKWSSRLPYGVLPKDLTSEETLEALSVATDRMVTVERGQKGQSLYWVVNRLDSPDGIPAKVAFTKVIQYYPHELHALTPWPIGVTKNRKVEWLTLEDYPNVLIAGAAGGGKSNELNAIIGTWVSMNRPDQLRLMLIDNKGGIEFTHWRGIPHLIGDMIKDEADVLTALESVIGIIKHRLQMFERLKQKKLSAFNAKVKDADRLPRLIVVVDEMSTLTGLDDSPDIQHALKVITAQGRAVGVHVILCTQHVSVNIIEGAIKTNMQVRASTKMPSEVSSRIILDTMSAATLPNIPGRMVFSLGRSEVIAQAPLITDGEIAEAVRIAREFPAADNREFDGGAVEAREKFSRDDLLALTISDFNGRLAASVIHEALGNEVIPLRKLREMVQSIIAEGRYVTWNGQRYELRKDRNVHVLHQIQQAAEQKLVRVQ